MNKTEWSALALVLALGAATGLCGLGWGLPGGRRQAFAPLDSQGARHLQERWERLYQGISSSHQRMEKAEPVTYLQGFQKVAPGWSFPPEPLVNSCRSFLLQPENPDEKKAFIILSRMRPWKLEFEPLYIQYGGAFIYPLGAFLKALSLLGMLALRPEMSHYLEQPQDMGALYLAARAFVMLFHVGSLTLLFFMGRRLSGWKTGLAAAFLFALSPTVAANSHLIKPHPYAAFWALAAAYFMIAARQDGSRRGYLSCGACAGMAVAANFTLATLLLLPIFPVVARGARAEWRRALSGAALAAGLFLVLNPYVILSPRDFAWETTIYAPTRLGLALSQAPRLLASGVQGMGLGLTVLVMGGVLFAWRQAGARRLLALTFWLAGLALWMRFSTTASDLAGLRIYLPLISIGVLLGADLLARLRCPPSVKAALMALVLMETGWRGYVVLANAHLAAGPHSTPARAADWIAAHVPVRATVGLVRYPEPAHTPPLAFDRYHLVFFDRPENLPAGREPDFLVVDREGRPLVDGWAQSRYDPPQEFLPWQAPWAGPAETSFINRAMFIYRRRGS